MGLIADAGFYYIGLLRRGQQVKCAAGGAGMVTISAWHSSRVRTSGLRVRRIGLRLGEGLTAISSGGRKQLHHFYSTTGVCPSEVSRLWDKSLSIKPQLPPGKLWDDVRKSPANSLFPAASAIYWMLGHDSIAAASQQARRESLEKVMVGFARRFPAFVRFTGFPADWQTLALWK